jgi:hypothetical protein
MVAIASSWRRARGRAVVGPPDGKTPSRRALVDLGHRDGGAGLRIATEGIVTWASFFDNGSYIIAGGMDRRMHVWNADSGAEVLAFTVPAHPRKIVIDRTSARVAVLTGGGAVVWTVPAFPGTLAEVRERARCSLDLEVVDAHLRAHSIDIAACSRVPW